MESHRDRSVWRQALCILPLVALPVMGCSSESPAGPTLSPTPVPAPTPSGPTADVFDFVLREGSRNAVVVGPVRAGNGPLDVTLDFEGDYIVLACVGTAFACRPMGGRPMAVTFNIPADFPAGPIQASVYFNYNYRQPAGDAKGTVRFAYNQF